MENISQLRDIRYYFSLAVPPIFKPLIYSKDSTLLDIRGLENPHNYRAYILIIDN